MVKMTPGAGGLQEARVRSMSSGLTSNVIVDCPHDHKATAQEKGECLEDYHRRFR